MIEREVSSHVKVIKDIVAYLVEWLMFTCILKTVEMFQHAYSYWFAEPTWAAEEDEIVEFVQLGDIASTIEVSLALSL